MDADTRILQPSLIAKLILRGQVRLVTRMARRGFKVASTTKINDNNRFNENTNNRFNENTNVKAAGEFVRRPALETKTKAEEVKIAPSKNEAEEVKVAPSKTKAEEVKISPSKNEAEEVKVAPRKTKAEEVKVAPNKTIAEEVKRAPSKTEAEEVKNVSSKNNKKSYLYGCMLPECLIMLKIRAFHHLSGICNRYRTKISIVFFKYISPVQIVSVARISCFSIP